MFVVVSVYWYCITQLFVIHKDVDLHFVDPQIMLWVPANHKVKICHIEVHSDQRNINLKVFVCVFNWASEACFS